jgi:hypothetical protein
MTTMTIPSPATRKYRVHDQFNVLEFEGMLIGEATTETKDAPRWTEIRIYKTTGGNYIVERVGVSLVYHRVDATCASGLGRVVGDLIENDARELEPCDRCNPGDIYRGDLTLDTRVRVETDRHSASAVAAEKLVDALTLTRTNGSRYVSNVAQSALSNALEHDPDLAGVLAAKTYVP